MLAHNSADWVFRYQYAELLAQAERARLAKSVKPASKAVRARWTIHLPKIMRA